MWVEADPILGDEAAPIVGAAKLPPTTGRYADPTEDRCLLVLYIKPWRIYECNISYLPLNGQPILTKLSVPTRREREAVSNVRSSGLHCKTVGDG